MKEPRNYPYLQPLNLTDDQVVNDTILRCNEALKKQLKSLSTANKNRVLLALQSQIGDQLDTFAATIHD